MRRERPDCLLGRREHAADVGAGVHAHREVGVASTAAPIRGWSGGVAAAIGIGALLVGCSVMNLRRIAPTTVDAAAAISYRLGWSLSSPLRTEAHWMPLTDVPGKATALYEASRSRPASQPFTDTSKPG